MLQLHRGDNMADSEFEFHLIETEASIEASMRATKTGLGDMKHTFDDVLRQRNASQKRNGELEAQLDAEKTRVTALEKENEELKAEKNDEAENGQNPKKRTWGAMNNSAVVLTQTARVCLSKLCSGDKKAMWYLKDNHDSLSAEVAIYHTDDRGNRNELGTTTVNLYKNPDNRVWCDVTDLPIGGKCTLLCIDILHMETMSCEFC